MIKKWRKSARPLSCHNGPVEVTKNLFCGGEEESVKMVSGPKRVDTLIPLNALDASIWELGYRGKVLYYPIRDYGTLPDDVLNDLVSTILERLRAGDRVGIFCIGGHGRTGYVASVVLGTLGCEDPIGHLRSHYCEKAVESNAQIEHIAEILGKPELADRYIDRSYVDLWDDIGLGYSLDLGSHTVHFPRVPDVVLCADCARFNDGICQKYRVPAEPDDLACDEFIEEVF